MRSFMEKEDKREKHHLLILTALVILLKTIVEFSVDVHTVGPMLCFRACLVTAETVRTNPVLIRDDKEQKKTVQTRRRTICRGITVRGRSSG